ncbi:MAG: hypothetical protein ORN51_02470 [Akkermansiaceae bacterium]|nr:hypothetical protein [Akkermansiaceae bacterium]
MRDQRFVAKHRGGSLELEHHQLLVLWAADCAERALLQVEAAQADDRLRQAIAVARLWARGEVRTGAAQKASVVAHAAARSLSNPVAVAVARAAGHAAATAHMADHCIGAACYALKAIEASEGASEAERAWQDAQVPEILRVWIVPAMRRRFPNGFRGSQG